MKAALVLSLLFVAASSSSSHLRRRDKEFVENARIVGGRDASVGEYPFYARWGGCGAVLINPEWLLSAAHCQGMSNTKPRMGAYNQTGDGTEVDVAEIIPHPDYDGSVINDYLLIRLKEPYTDAIPLVVNSDEQQPADTDELVVIGLGRLDDVNWTSPEHLQEVVVPNHPAKDCASYYGAFRQDIMLCAGTDQVDSCVGDSGGPLFTSDGVLVGITSFGDGCAKKDRPGVYARVSAIKDWLDDAICTKSVYSVPSTCPGESPTTPRSCGDSKAPNPILEAPGIPSCDWIRSHDGFPYCEFYEVATACRQTCGVCQRLARRRQQQD